MPGTRSFSLELRRNKMEPQYSVEWSSPTEISTVLVTVVLPVAREDGVMIPRRVCAGVNWISAEVAQAEAGFWCLGEVVFGGVSRTSSLSASDMKLRYQSGLIVRYAFSSALGSGGGSGGIGRSNGLRVRLGRRRLAIRSDLRPGTLGRHRCAAFANGLRLGIFRGAPKAPRLRGGIVWECRLQGPESVPRRKTADNGLDRCRRIK